MVFLQNKLNLRVSQRQILTPGLVQMVSVLALNKLELKEMINTEIMENPVLEEFDPSVPLLDEVAGREEARDREDARELKEQESPPATAEEKKDPFDEIDFGSFFRDYLDPGYRSSSELEEIDRPSFENFLSLLPMIGGRPERLRLVTGTHSGGSDVHRRIEDTHDRANDQQDGHLHASIQSERSDRGAPCGNLHGEDR